MTEKTDWYEPHQHPVRDGVYQLQNTTTGMIFYSRWLTNHWCIGSVDKEQAAGTDMWSIVQDRWPWRGLTEKHDDA